MLFNYFHLIAFADVPFQQFLVFPIASFIPFFRWNKNDKLFSPIPFSKDR